MKIAVIPNLDKKDAELYTHRIIEILHEKGAEVLMSSHVYKFTPAEKVLEIAKKNNVRVAILKDGSPSCGSKKISDGTFTGTKISGEGVLARLLIENGIPVFNENEVHLAMILASGDPNHHHH